MKITSSDKEKLFSMLDSAVERIGREKIAQHKALKLGKDAEKRFRWDIFNAAGIKLGDGVGINGDINLYSYMNDSHIDTALRAYVESRGL